MAPAVIIRGNREICAKTPEGRAEYIRRRRVAWERQKGLCALCKMRLPWCNATSDHICPRKMGGGDRDDSQENIQAVCWWCNGRKGSRRL